MIETTRPLPFVWPYWPLFWGVCVWVFAPEFRIVRTARKSAGASESADAGSMKVIMRGGAVAALISYPLAWVSAFRAPVALDPAIYVLGVAIMIAGSLLRRHCFRQLGASFTGDVRARPDQVVVTTGAYRFLRHPSYTAGILMALGIGCALGSWASIAVQLIVSFVIYGYRIAVEERTLVAVIGEPYREFMRKRRRLIPFLY